MYKGVDLPSIEFEIRTCNMVLDPSFETLLVGGGTIG